MVGCASAHRSPPAASPPPSPLRSQLPLAVHRHVLTNGLEVLLQPDHHTVFVAVEVDYHVGGRDDPPGRSGLAHLVEHLMFGRTLHAKREVYGSLREVNARGVDGRTSRDRTVYRETVPASELEAVLWLESERLGFLQTTKEQIDLALSVVANERREREENSPYGMIAPLVNPVLYPQDHPYARQTIGTPGELASVTPVEVEAFLETYYVPDDATLVLVGDFDEASTLALVEKYFSPIPKGLAPLARWPPMPIQLKQDRTVSIEADVKAPLFWLTWPAPALTEAESWDAEVGVALGRFTFGEMWWKKVTPLQSIAVGADLDYDADELAGDVSLGVTLRTGLDPKDALPRARELVQSLCTHAFTARELGQATHALEASIVFGLESIDSRAKTFGFDAQLFGDPIHFARDLDRLATPDLPAAQAELRALLCGAHALVTYVVPTPGAPIAGRIAWVR